MSEEKELKLDELSDALRIVVEKRERLELIRIALREHRSAETDAINALNQATRDADELLKLFIKESPPGTDWAEKVVRLERGDQTTFSKDGRRHD